MKARLSSTVWLLVFWVTLLLIAAVGFSSYAGSHSAADAAAVPGGANGALVGAITLALVAVISIVYVLTKRVLGPVDELAKFSERVVSGDVRARAEDRKSTRLNSSHD